MLLAKPQRFCNGQRTIHIPLLDDTKMPAPEDVTREFGEHRESGVDNRVQPRDEYSRPAKVFVGDKCYKAVIRDISDTGVGLLHDDAFEPGPIQLQIDLYSESSVRMKALLLWCRPEGNRFCSGARFLNDSKP
jgi:hypothetical protein